MKDRLLLELLERYYCYEEWTSKWVDLAYNTTLTGASYSTVVGMFRAYLSQTSFSLYLHNQ